MVLPCAPRPPKLPKYWTPCLSEVVLFKLKVRPGSETPSFATPDLSSPSEGLDPRFGGTCIHQPIRNVYPGKRRPRSCVIQGRGENGKVRSELDLQPDRQGANTLEPTARRGHTETGANSPALLHHLLTKRFIMTITSASSAVHQ